MRQISFLKTKTLISSRIRAGGQVTLLFLFQMMGSLIVTGKITCQHNIRRYNFIAHLCNIYIIYLYYIYYIHGCMYTFIFAYIESILSGK